MNDQRPQAHEFCPYHDIAVRHLELEQLRVVGTVIDICAFVFSQLRGRHAAVGPSYGIENTLRHAVACIWFTIDCGGVAGIATL